MKLTNDKKGYVYIKNNKLKHNELFVRALGAFKGKIIVVGRTMRRTWSLLAKKIVRSVNTISLIHNPRDMVLAIIITVKEKLPPLKLYFHDSITFFLMN